MRTISSTEPSKLGRLVPLKHDKDGNPLFIEMPLRVQLMENAANELFEHLGSYTVSELKTILTQPQFTPLIEIMIYIRTLMGGEGSI